ALAKFPTAANLYGFIHASMPFQKPNSLSDTQYYQSVSFLLRQNELIDAQTEVNDSKAASIVVSRATPVPTAQPAPVQEGNTSFTWLIVPVGFIVSVGLILILIK